MSETEDGIRIISTIEYVWAKAMPDGRWKVTTVGGDEVYFTDSEFRTQFGKHNPQFSNVRSPGPLHPPKPPGPPPVA